MYFVEHLALIVGKEGGGGSREGCKVEIYTYKSFAMAI